MDLDIWDDSSYGDPCDLFSECAGCSPHGSMAVCVELGEHLYELILRMRSSGCAAGELRRLTASQSEFVALVYWDARRRSLRPSRARTRARRAALWPLLRPASEKLQAAMGPLLPPHRRRHRASLIGTP